MENFLITLNKYRFRKVEFLTNEFIDSLKENDLFSLHCKDFVNYLGFKRCNKNFRLAFDKWLLDKNIQYVISNKPLTEFMLDNFLNAEKLIKEEMDISYNSANPNGKTQRQFFEWIAKDTGKTFNEVVSIAIKNRRNIGGTLEIKMDKQKLNGSFQGGCWLILLKKLLDN